MLCIRLFIDLRKKLLTKKAVEVIILKRLRECWNGRQARLRCVWLRRVGSSPISRTKKNTTLWVVFFLVISEDGTRKAVKKHAGGMFLGRGRVPQISDASTLDVDEI